ILFDVDKFKKINDTLGHIAGDKVLKKVAECLEETYRKDDFIARYGGDEFVVIIDGVTEKMAVERISAFNRVFKRKRFISQKTGEINLSVSAGATSAIKGDTMENLVERADRAMYALKRMNS
ncbi:GGDEF domain-containing protein, partial [Deltaproteobacteria bacterium]|nr:GGDEF domain-containing protein [Deltaproteobacteria bacterium]